MDEKIRATLRVPADDLSLAVPRPSSSRMEKAASVLQNLGFDVLHRSRFGIDVEGTPEQYRAHLNVTIPSTPQVFTTKVTPAGEDLKNLIEGIEIIPPVKLLES